MKSLLFRALLPGILLACISSPTAPGRSLCWWPGPFGLSSGVAYAHSAVTEVSPAPSRQAAITREQIEEHFREFVLKRCAWPAEDLVIGQISFDSLPTLPPGQATVEVSASPRERFLGEVKVTLLFRVDGKDAATMRVVGKVERYCEVIHSVRAMKRDEVVTEADIQAVRINLTSRPDRYLLEPDHVVGKRLVSSIGPNKPLTPRDLDQPHLIKRGDPVTILYQQDGIRLSTRGEARDKGGLGDRIRIRNLDSKRNIQGRIIDSQTVEALP